MGWKGAGLGSCGWKSWEEREKVGRESDRKGMDLELADGKEKRKTVGKRWVGKELGLVPADGKERRGKRWEKIGIGGAGFGA